MTLFQLESTLAGYVSSQVSRSLRGADAVVLEVADPARSKALLLVARSAQAAGIPSVVVVHPCCLRDGAKDLPRGIRVLLRQASKIVVASGCVHWNSAGHTSLPEELGKVAGRTPAVAGRLASWQELLETIELRSGGVPDSGCAVLGTRDLDDVVSIHCEAFPQAVLTQLGPRVVRRYYLWQFIGPHPSPFALGAWQKGQLVGFVFGGIRREAVSGFVRHSLGAIAWGAVRNPSVIRQLPFSKVAAVIRALVRPAKPSRFARRIAGRRRGDIHDDQAPSFGILSIATSCATRGSGVAGELMGAAEDRAIAVGCRKMNLTVSPENARAVRFYEKLGWQQLSAEAAWSGAMTKVLEVR